MNTSDSDENHWRGCRALRSWAAIGCLLFAAVEISLAQDVPVSRPEPEQNREQVWRRLSATEAQVLIEESDRLRVELLSAHFAALSQAARAETPEERVRIISAARADSAAKRERLREVRTLVARETKDRAWARRADGVPSGKE